MPDPRDSVELTIAGKPRTSGAGGSSGPSVPPGNRRPWLGLFFKCAGVYSRAYRNAAGNSYMGRCPTCGKTVRFGVGTGGTSERIFEVSCRE